VTLQDDASMTGSSMRFRGHPLRREIALVLALKAVAIAVIWAVFFGPGTQPTIDGPAVERHLTTPSGGSR
jgi:hypothetical protein